ncbi:MAG: hypothetical protein JXK16_03670 [Thiotrichales bacterium]|nr:hypothetical protein [Thiotrichales bacterium]
MIESLDVILDFKICKGNILKLRKANEYFKRYDFINVDLNDDLSVTVESNHADDSIIIVIDLLEILIND